MRLSIVIAATAAASANAAALKARQGGYDRESSSSLVRN